jgi:hypothetical protein
MAGFPQMPNMQLLNSMWMAGMNPQAMANPYAVDDPGLSVDPNFTTVMLRNIPNKYTTKMLLAVLDRRFAKQYDYVYLPVDFVNHCNVGYAFINLRSAEIRQRFYRHFHNQKVKEVLPGFNSKKVLKQVCEVNKAKVQGAKENIRRIKQMNMLMTRLKDHPDWVPLLFDVNGTCIPLDLDAPVEKREPMQNKPKRSPYTASSPYPGMSGGQGWDMNAGFASMYNSSYLDPFTQQQLAQHIALQQQAQAAYNVAVASATAAAVSAASSPSDYMSPTDWYGNKENSSSASTASSWGPQSTQPLSGMANALNKLGVSAGTMSGKNYWGVGQPGFQKNNKYEDSENMYPVMGYQFQ